MGYTQKFLAGIDLNLLFYHRYGQRRQDTDKESIPRIVAALIQNDWSKRGNQTMGDQILASKGGVSPFVFERPEMNAGNE